MYNAVQNPFVLINIFPPDVTPAGKFLLCLLHLSGPISNTALKMVLKPLICDDNVSPTIQALVDGRYLHCRETDQGKFYALTAQTEAYIDYRNETTHRSQVIADRSLLTYRFFDEFLHMVVNRTKRQEQKSDVALLDKQIKSLQNQIDELVMMKARREIDGDFYNRNFQSLKEDLFALQEKRVACADRQLIATNQKARMERIKEAFSTHEVPLTEYDEDLFAALVEKAVVHSPTDITFMLYGGMEYRVDGAKFKPKDRRGRPRKNS